MFRFEKRPNRRICERYENIRQLKSELWELRFESLKNKPTKEWTIEDLERATKSLKNNQSYVYGKRPNL